MMRCTQVLRFGSEYFRTLLSPRWAEEHSNGIIHVDTQHHSERNFQAVLSWIYTGATTPVVAEDLPGLLCTASYYLLPALHAEALRMAQGALSVHNALEWLLFAEQQRQEGLKEAALAYVGANYRHIRRLRPQDSTQLMKHIHVTYPDMGMELVDAAVEEMRLASSQKRGREEEEEVE